jgi:hypothetical protein
MAAELFTTFAEFKDYVGGRVNQSLTLKSLEATIYETARRHIVPFLTKAQYDRLVAGAGLSSSETTLLDYVKRPLALLTMYEYSKVAAIEVGESGMHRIESESRKSAYRYQEREYKEDALVKGYNALEEMLDYLTTNNASFTAWRASDEGMLHRTTLLNYASTFRALTQPDCDRYTYECIRPIIMEVQQFGVEALLPESYWTAFMVKYLAGTMSDAEKIVLKYMRQSIAHHAIAEAIRQRWIKIDHGRISIHEDFGDQRNTNQTMPSTTGSGLYVSHDVWGDRYTSKWMAYIRDNADEFEGVFDEASGGTNTGADAWHINSTDEQATADAAIVTANKRAIFRM